MLLVIGEALATNGRVIVTRCLFRPTPRPLSHLRLVVQPSESGAPLGTAELANFLEGRRSTRIAQPRCHAVDRQMDAALQPLVGRVAL